MTQASETQADDPRDRLERYLARKTQQGAYYFKSRRIAGEIGLSPKQIGVLLGQLRTTGGRVEVEPWSYTNATTWRAVRADDT